jgi:hypothetical protein
MNSRVRKSTTPPRSVQELMYPKGGSMQDMLRHARLIEKLDTEFRSLLPPAMSEHVRVANLRDGLLILVTPVAPIATRLRMEAPQIIERLAERGISRIDEMKVRVEPFPVDPQRPRRKRELSAAAKQALAAMGIEQEPK